jgi:hypothetical protein
MKPIALLKAVNVIKMESWTSPADFRYQNETSEFKIGCDRIAAQKRGETYTPKPWEGLPYLAKDDLGKIHVRGFLHQRVAQNPNGTFRHPSSLSTEEVIRRLSRAWKDHARRNRATEITHHRLVFSLSKEFHDAIVETGRNPDLVLKGIVERTMHSFEENFHRGDSVGYSYGLHHDTDNLHAHVFIHPRTRDGEFIGMSEQLQRLAQRGAVSRHKGQLKFIRESARRRAAQVVKELADPKEAVHLKYNFQSDRIYYAPRQSHTTRTKKDLRPVSPVDHLLEQKRATVVTFDRQIATKREAIRDATNGRHITGIFRLGQPKWMRLLQQAQTATLFRELRQLQTKRYQAVSDYWATRKRMHLVSRAVTPFTPQPASQGPAPAAKIGQTRTQRPSITIKPAIKSVRTHRGI